MGFNGSFASVNFLGQIQSPVGLQFQALRNFVFDPTSVLRVGSSRAQTSAGNGGSANFPGEINYVGLYNQKMNASTMRQNYFAGIQNSLPVFNTNFSLSVFQNDTWSIPYNNYTEMDANGNPVYAVVLRTLPSRGRLYQQGVPLNIGDVLVTNLTQYKPFIPGSFSPSDPNCIHQTTFDSFQVSVTDGLGDGSVNCTALPGDLSCAFYNSTTNLCLKQSNVPPFPTNQYLNVFTTLTVNFSLLCTDNNTAPGFIFSYASLLNQTDPELGTLYNYRNGICDTTNPLTPPDVNVSALCYVAKPTLLPIQILGFDYVTFQCVDQGGLISNPGLITFQINNNLIPGCGGSIPNVPCKYQGLSYKTFPVALNGYDAAFLKPYSQRLFRIDTLPEGIVTYNGTNVTIGAILPADPTTGNLTLGFTSYYNYYNAICGVNLDSFATCVPSFYDGLGNVIGGCASPPCATYIGYSIGYATNMTQTISQNTTFNGTINGTVNVTMPVFDFSPSVLATQILVLVVQNGGGNIVGPGFIPIIQRSFIFVSFVFNHFSGDTARVGFAITIPDGVIMQMPLLQNSSRVTFFQDNANECRVDIQGCEFGIGGRAYQSDLNEMLSYIGFAYAYVTPGNLSASISIWVSFTSFTLSCLDLTFYTGSNQSSGQYRPFHSAHCSTHPEGHFYLVRIKHNLYTC